MDTIAARMKSIRGIRSRRSFAEALCITESTLRNYEQGLSQPNADVLARVCAIEEIAPEWLLLGQGPMKRDAASPAADGSRDRQILFYVVETLEEVLHEIGKKLPPDQKAKVVCDLYELQRGEGTAAAKPAAILRLINGALAANE